MNKSFFSVFGGCFVVLLSGCSSNKNREELPEVVFVRRVELFHTVSEEDSVASIAMEYNMRRADLIRLNDLHPPYQLYKGQKLIILPKVGNKLESDSDIVIQENVDNVGEETASLVSSSKKASEVVHDDVSNGETKEQSEQKEKKEPAEPKSKDEGFLKLPDDENGEEQTARQKGKDSLANQEEAKSDSENITVKVASEEKLNPEQESAVDHQKSVKKNEEEYLWPIEYGSEKISKHFGEIDTGIIMDASAGTAVVSIADGEVVVAGVLEGAAAAYGKTVIIKHNGKKKLSIYAHLQEISTKVGESVAKGDKIGFVGKSGTAAKQPQLYFEINDISGTKRTPLDPEKFLPKA